MILPLPPVWSLGVPIHKSYTHALVDPRQRKRSSSSLGAVDQVRGQILYVQEVVTLQKKISNIFASENEVYTIY